VFFPPLPEMPRLQFLKSFSGADDLGGATGGGFQRFVLGEPQTEQDISKPYGVAIHDGKIYVCDVGRRTVEVLDVRKGKFGYLTKDRRLMNPVNIHITDDGTKYVADPTAGAVLVFDRDDNFSAMLGKKLGIAPIDVTVRGRRCYVSDFTSNQIVVFDISTQQEIARVGEEGVAQPQGATAELPPGQILLISDLALDQRGNIYVTDKAAARITQFDQSGRLQRVIGRWGSNIDEFIRPKGIAIDSNQRIWVVDAASEVAKIYDDQARLLLFFGLPGNKPGMMNLPAKIVVDYKNVHFFQQYAVEGARIEFIVLVSNQYGPNKVSVYGFGQFPLQARAIADAQHLSLQTGTQGDLPPQAVRPGQPSLTPGAGRRPAGKQEQIADLYQRSLTQYRSGQFEQAREGFTEVLNSGTIPPAMARAIQGYLAEIDSRASRSGQKQQIADLYYRSVSLYRSGQLEEARNGFVTVLKSGLIPPAMEKTIENYLADIENALTRRRSTQPR
jgi:sugar lactone lactonase YvrE/TolA-binding protein